MKFKINRKAAFRYNLLAGFMFICLAIYGWGLPVSTAISYLIICLLAVVLIVGITALIGFILSKLRGSSEHSFYEDEEQD